MAAASAVEPLEEVIDLLKERCRTSHIHRLQRGECTIEAGFVWSDILTDLERISDHCCNIALSLLEGREHRLHTHEGTADHGKIYQMHYDLFLKEFLS